MADSQHPSADCFPDPGPVAIRQWAVVQAIKGGLAGDMCVAEAERLARFAQFGAGWGAIAGPGCVEPATVGGISPLEWVPPWPAPPFLDFDPAHLGNPRLMQLSSDDRVLGLTRPQVSLLALALRYVLLRLATGSEPFDLAREALALEQSHRASLLLRLREPPLVAAATPAPASCHPPAAGCGTRSVSEETRPTSGSSVGCVATATVGAEGGTVTAPSSEVSEGGASS